MVSEAKGMTPLPIVCPKIPTLGQFSMWLVGPNWTRTPVYKPSPNSRQRTTAAHWGQYQISLDPDCSYPMIQNRDPAMNLRGPEPSCRNCVLSWLRFIALYSRSSGTRVTEFVHPGYTQTSNMNHSSHSFWSLEIPYLTSRGCGWISASP